MQYLVSVIDDETRSIPAEQDAAEKAATGAFNDRLKAECDWVAGGLASPRTATVADRLPSRQRILSSFDICHFDNGFEISLIRSRCTGVARDTSEDAP
jgi:hypothetical protein